MKLELNEDQLQGLADEQYYWGQFEYEGIIKL